MISKKIVAAVGAGAVAGAIGISLAGGALTASASPATTHQGAAAGAAHQGTHARGGHRGLAGIAGRFVHGTGVVKTKTGFETVAVDRGTVSAVSPTSVTIKSADGVSETFTAVSTSKFRVDGKKSTISGVQVGATAGTVAVIKGAENDIKVLVVRPARAASGTGA